MATADRQISSERCSLWLQYGLLRNIALTGVYVRCVYAITPPNPHENVIRVMPDPPSVGGGADKPD